MSDPFVHLGEDGQPCPHHAAATPSTILALATIGSRASRYNHDVASKLQGLMMALDELGELLESRADPDEQRAIETAQDTLRDISRLLNVNRALTRTSIQMRAVVREVVLSAGERSGIAVHGELPDVAIEGTLSLLAHGLGLVLDVAGGPARAVEVEVTPLGDHVELAFATGDHEAPHAANHLALGAFAIAHAGGELRCTRDHRLIVRLPVAT